MEPGKYTEKPPASFCRVSSQIAPVPVFALHAARKIRQSSYLEDCFRPVRLYYSIKVYTFTIKYDNTDFSFGEADTLVLDKKWM